MNGNNENPVYALYEAITGELINREPSLALRTSASMGRLRQEFVPEKRQYFTAVLENHILDRTRSAVLVIEAAGADCLLRLCCPLRQEEYNRLAGLNYTPPLRSKLYLSVGLSDDDPPYAWSSVRLSAHSGVMDVLEALRVLGRELETYLRKE